jgi:hypothetical protein
LQVRRLDATLSSERALNIACEILNKYKRDNGGIHKLIATFRHGGLQAIVQAGMAARGAGVPSAGAGVPSAGAGVPSAGAGV